MDVNELSLDKIGTLTVPVRIAILAVVFVLLLLGGYLVLVKPRLAILSAVQKEQNDLKSTYQVKYTEAATLPEYQKQLQEMQVILRGMLAQLTTPSEIPQLIDSISKLAIANGLEIDLVKPKDEVERDFYAEMPIDISVTGDYHSLGLFISQVGTLQKIITFNDFTITIAPPQNQPNPSSSDADKRAYSVKGSTVLVMDATARTYRYIDQPAATAASAASAAATTSSPPATGGH